MTDEAKAALAKAKAAMPHLTWAGIGTYDREKRRCVSSGEEFERDRRDEAFDLKQVATAIAFLRLCVPTKGAAVNSYGLKHAAERWGREHGMQPYVANGELIVAACYLGLSIGYEPRNSPNVGVGVQLRRLQELDPECIWSRKWSKVQKRRA